MFRSFLLLGVLAFLAVHASAAVAGVCYQTHLQNIGWTPLECDGEVSGTVGQSRRMEAIKIWSTTPDVSICYKVHMADKRWGPTACDGAQAGTTGESRRIEAMHIWSPNLVPSQSIEYQSHLQNRGWVMSRYDGTMTGTTGQSRRLEAIRIYLTSRRTCPDASYRFGNGWELVAVKSGEDAWGTPSCEGQVGFTSGSTTWAENLNNDFTRRADGWTTATTTAGSTLWLWLDRLNNLANAWYFHNGDWRHMGAATKYFSGGIP